MYEDFGTIINKGFHSWVRNLNICIPFILNSLFDIALSIIFFGVIGYLIISSNSGIINDPASLSETELSSMILKGLTENISLSAALVLVFVLSAMFVNSFFTADCQTLEIDYTPFKLYNTEYAVMMTRWQ